MKNLFSFFLALICICALSMCVIAEEISIEQHLSTNLISKENDIGNIVSEVNGKKDEIEKYLTGKISVNRAFKVYELNDVNVVKKYLESHDFSANFSKDYFWQVPILDDSGTAMNSFNLIRAPSYDKIAKINGGKFPSDLSETLVRANAGKWTVGMQGKDAPEEMIKILSSRENTKKIFKDANISTVHDLKVVLLTAYRTYLIYANSKSVEFAFPYSTRDDFTGLKNGALYKMNDLINALSKVNIKFDAPGQLGAIGGATSANSVQESSSNSIYIFGTISAVCIACIVLLLTRKKVIRTN